MQDDITYNQIISLRGSSIKCQALLGSQVSEPTCSNFDYSGLLTETVVMGNLAIKYPNRKLKWDGENMKVTNFPEANDFVRMNYRASWEI